MPLFPSFKRRQPEAEGTSSAYPSAEDFAALVEKIDAIGTKVNAVSCDYYNNKAHDHAMDVARRNPDGVSGGMWNSIVARSSGAELCSLPRGIIYHGYKVEYVRKIGNKPVVQEVHADEISVVGTLVMFFMKGRIQKIVRQDDVVEINIVTPTTLGEELDKRVARHK